MRTPVTNQFTCRMRMINERMNRHEEMLCVDAQRTHPVFAMQIANIDDDAIEHLHQPVQGDKQIRTAISTQMALGFTAGQKTQARTILLQCGIDQRLIQRFRTGQQVFQGVLAMAVQVKTATFGLSINGKGAALRVLPA
eukprot:gnl/TRDRNA2_/TRDRNA2_158095_c2_seq2.p2 gnl/TRDRNA2_/TRDRNA2_158095_c2~~gnl/TRDRNA2_/TRDRNA2_158095_c2_seq2.p2  ORF type:complete len:139 (-),score=12.10 gnl/TRDRNA2_/TRDRNA2_158095_c2_seq2:3-419(-)